VKETLIREGDRYFYKTQYLQNVIVIHNSCFALWMGFHF